MDEDTGTLTITLESDEREYNLEDMSLTLESTDEEVTDALSPVIEEEVGIDMRNEFESGYWTVKRIESTGNIYVFPKSTAGRAL